MTVLKVEDLNFAREHIEKYYDSDFFPKPFDFDALWANWDEVVQELTSKNIQKLSISTPRMLAAPKPGLTYRVVHQLEPLDCLVYTALVASICEKVEQARPDLESRIACSYRIVKAEGSFFSAGTGWAEFTEETEDLASEFEWVLSFDISDFYNQIYLHRLNNAIEYVDAKLKDVATDIEQFITAMNSKASQGIPVGPAASIVLAEAVLLDVDSLITSTGLSHTRYVDDFRVFSDNKADLEKLLENVTVYLYEAHRLSIATEKTALVEASVFVSDKLHSDDAEEKDELMDVLDGFSPYSQDFEGEEDDDESWLDDDGDDVDVEVEDQPETKIAEALVEAMEKVVASKRLDLGIARAVIRTARRNKVGELVESLLGNLCFFAPVAGDVFVYLDAMTDDDFADQNSELVASTIDLDCVKHEFLRYWLTWYLARHFKRFSNSKTRKFVYESPWLELKAIAAVEEGNLPWIRGLKNKISDHSPRERRAIIYGSKILPEDEREAWLKNVINNAATKFDIWMAKWVLGQKKAAQKQEGEIAAKA